MGHDEPSVRGVSAEGELTTTATALVGVGASAGGLEAIERLLHGLATDSGIAVVVVQHLSPDHKSHMAELLRRQTSLAVRTVEDGEPLCGNTVYVLPPGKKVELRDGRLRLFDRSATSGLELPIDGFFQSLAQCRDLPLAAVVLSGTGSDGSKGLQHVERGGGLVLCQDEHTAKFNGMPLNAQATGAVHLVLPPEKMGAVLAELAVGGDRETLVKRYSDPIDRTALDPIFDLLRVRFGLDFSRYKASTVGRRLARRIEMTEQGGIDEYTERLRVDHNELNVLYRDLLIGVTRFFRDEEAFAAIERDAIPALAEAAGNRELRIWVAGCASGEEAYSLAILLHEVLGRDGRPVRFKMFATDMHPGSLRTASSGIFPASAIEGIPERFRRYFDPVEGQYRIAKRIREQIVFAPHNVIQDAPFTNIDLLSCRNLLIYLREPAQQRALALFHYALRDGGVLWLGPSETPGGHSDRFEPLDDHWKIYRKHGGAPRGLELHLGDVRQGGYDAFRREPPEPLAQETLATPGLPGVSPRLLADRSLHASYNRLLDRFMPPSVLIDDDFRVLQSFGGAEHYLRVPGGRLTTSVVDLLADELKLAVSTALQRCRREGVAVSLAGIRHEDERLRVQVEEIAHARTQAVHYLVTFHPEAGAPRGAAPASDEPPETATESFQTSRDHVRHLETELTFARENLQATIEELETSNEELQATNEELTSSNEELQSTNEELHSVNEELHTVNVEHQRKIEELTRLTLDIENLLRNIDVGVMFLDEHLHLRRLTPQVSQVFHLTEDDLGRPVESFNRVLEGIDLAVESQRVLAGAAPLAREVRGRDGGVWLLRLLPYRDGARTRGVVLTLVDIATIKAAENELRRVSAIVASSSEPIIGVDPDGKVRSLNVAAEGVFDTVEAAARGRSLADLLPEARRATLMRHVFDAIDGRTSEPVELALGEAPGVRCFDAVAFPIRDAGGRVESAAVIFHEVTRLREAQRMLRLRSDAMDASENGILIVDALAEDQPVVYANRGFARLTGFDPASIAGRNCRILQGPDTDPEAVDEIRRAVREQRECNVTLLNYRRDGTPFWNNLQITPVRNDDGLVTHFIGVQHDITPIVEQEQAIRRSEEEYRATFENAAVGIAHVGIDGRWLRVNEKLCEIVGYSRDELLECTFQDITHPDDLQADLQQFLPLMRGETDGYALKKRYLHKGGHTVWVNLTTSLRRDEQGQPHCCIAIIEDISDRERTERQLRQSRSLVGSILESITDAFFVVDDRWHFTYVNRAAANLFGRRTEELIGVDLESLADHPLLVQIWEPLQKVKRARHSDTFDVHLSSPDCWMAVRSFPIDEGLSVIMTDVTARKQTEKFLEKARLAADVANRAKSDFLANMSHEIRTPMTAMLGFAEIIERQMADGESVDPENVRTIQRNGRYLLRLINDLLDLSKIEAGKLEVRPARFDLPEFLSDVYTLLHYRAHEKGLDFRVEFRGPVPQSIRSDRARLQQVLINLIGNAVKFTDAGEVVLAVSYEREASPPRLRLEVIDTGIGIPADRVASLFQPFTQLHQEVGDALGGTGLGLSICKRLLERLGGSIEVHSEEGHGSTFTARVPVGPSSAIQLVEPEMVGRRQTKTAARDELPRIDARILVADDARDICRIAQVFLTRAGADVATVGDGEAAVQAVAEAEAQGRPFEIVLMDMNMPRMSGYEATEILRQRGFAGPILALTAAAMRDELDEAVQAGCDHYLTKPIDSKSLIRTIVHLRRKTGPQPS